MNNVLPNMVFPNIVVDNIRDGFSDRDKSYCVDANYFKGGSMKMYKEKSRRQLVFGLHGWEGHRDQQDFDRRPGRRLDRGDQL